MKTKVLVSHISFVSGDIVHILKYFSGGGVLQTNITLLSMVIVTNVIMAGIPKGMPENNYYTKIVK